MFSGATFVAKHRKYDCFFLFPNIFSFRAIGSIRVWIHRMVHFCFVRRRVADVRWQWWIFQLDATPPLVGFDWCISFYWVHFDEPRSGSMRAVTLWMFYLGNGGWRTIWISSIETVYKQCLRRDYLFQLKQNNCFKIILNIYSSRYSLHCHVRIHRNEKWRNKNCLQQMLHRNRHSLRHRLKHK